MPTFNGESYKKYKKTRTKLEAHKLKCYRLLEVRNIPTQRAAFFCGRERVQISVSFLKYIVGVKLIKYYFFVPLLTQLSQTICCLIEFIFISRAL